MTVCFSIEIMKTCCKPFLNRRAVKVILKIRSFFLRIVSENVKF